MADPTQAASTNTGTCHEAVKMRAVSPLASLGEQSQKDATVE